MKSFFKSLFAAIVITFSLVGIITFVYSIFYTMETAWHRYSFSFSIQTINRSFMLTIFIGTLVLIFLLTIIFVLIGHNKILRDQINKRYSSSSSKWSESFNKKWFSSIYDILLNWFLYFVYKEKENTIFCVLLYIFC